MNVSTRAWWFVGTLAVVIGLVGFRATRMSAAGAPPPLRGQLTEHSLGNLLRATGLDPKKEKKRYDFSFDAKYRDEEWELSMSAVLSQNGSSIWVMAWLDELPRSTAEVPRAALLRLLASNDRLGKGKFFAYIAGNRRFVLQRVVENQNMTTAKLRRVLQDLGASVVETYPRWSVANWNSGAGQNTSANNSPPSRQNPRGRPRRAKSASKSPKYRQPRRKQ